MDRISFLGEIPGFVHTIYKASTGTQLPSDARWDRDLLVGEQKLYCKLDVDTHTLECYTQKTQFVYTITEEELVFPPEDGDLFAQISAFLCSEHYFRPADWANLQLVNQRCRVNVLGSEVWKQIYTRFV